MTSVYYQHCENKTQLLSYIFGIKSHKPHTKKKRELITGFLKID